MAATHRRCRMETGRTRNVKTYPFGALKISSLSWCIQYISGVDFFLIYFLSSSFSFFLFSFLFKYTFLQASHVFVCYSLLISPLVSPSSIITSALHYFSFLHSSCPVIKQCLSHQTIMRHGVNRLACLASLMTLHTLLDELCRKRWEDGNLDMMM